eukprot:scaffold1147_cov125-Isochrysis_galbana.AAC.4
MHMMPRIRIGAFYKSGNDTGVALRQEGTEVAWQVYKTAGGAGTPMSTTLALVREAGALEYAGEITSDKWMCSEQVRCMLQDMRDGVQAFDVIIVNTPEANQLLQDKKPMWYHSGIER